MTVLSFIRVIGARRLARRFLRKSVVVGKETDVITEKNAQLLLSLIQAAAPVLTGRYRASWRIEREQDQRVVTTDAPQAARLELGFVGVDSLGRHYNQPPFPHVRPAADLVEGAYFRDMTTVVVRGL